MPGDDLTQQLADVIRPDDDTGWAEEIARAVLASGLVVPRAQYDQRIALLRMLSDEFIRNDTVPLSAVNGVIERNSGFYCGDDCYHELLDDVRALTQQETP